MIMSGYAEQTLHAIYVMSSKALGKCEKVDKSEEVSFALLTIF